MNVNKLIDDVNIIMSNNRHGHKSFDRVFQICMHISYLSKTSNCNTHINYNQLRGIINNIRFGYVYNESTLYVGLPLLIKLEELLDRIETQIMPRVNGNAIRTDNDIQ